MILSVSFDICSNIVNVLKHTSLFSCSQLARFFSVIEALSKSSQDVNQSEPAAPQPVDSLQPFSTLSLSSFQVPTCNIYLFQTIRRKQDKLYKDVKIDAFTDASPYTFYNNYTITNPMPAVVNNARNDAMTGKITPRSFDLSY